MEKQNRIDSSKNRAKKQYSIFDANYLWQIFTHHKKWFALSVFLCLCLGAAYVYFTRPAYNVVGKMMIIDRRQNNSNSLSSASLSLLNSLPMNLGSSLNVGRSLGSENEKEILKTKLLAKDVVEDLGLYTEIRHQKLLKSRLLYKNQPVNVTVSQECLQAMNEGLYTYSIRLTIDKDDAGFTFEGVLKKNKKKIEIAEQTFAKLPAVIHTEIGDLTFTENVLPTEEDRKPFLKDYRLKVTITPPMIVAKKFVNRLTIASASKKATSIIQINLQDENVARGTDFVNSLVAHYNDRSNTERQEEAAKNDEFVNERLAKIDGELGLTDADFEKVKKQYKVTDPKVDAEEVMTKKGVYETQLVNYGIQLQLLDYLNEYVKDPSNLNELIPVNFGAYGNDASVGQQNTFKASSYSGDAISLIKQHNALVTDRNQLLTGVSEMSPHLQQINRQIKDLHPAIIAAIQRDRQSISIRQRLVEQEYSRYMSRVGNAPEQERVLTDVTRQRTIKQSAYISLLQKREEIAMELANTTDKGRLIDETMAQGKMKPKTLVALLSSLLLGLLLPYVFFFIRRNTKKFIESEIDLKLMSRLPLVGTIPASGQGNDDDAFRLIRNNILHLLGDEKKTILVTSANQGDGKTFCATHLAEAFNRMGEKTLCCSLLEILPESVSGSAHPGDLLAHKDLHQALANLRETYDVIILDAPEMNPYNETLIGGLADVTCFVCCSGKTQKTAIESLDKLKKDNNLSTSCIVLNS